MVGYVDVKVRFAKVCHKDQVERWLHFKLLAAVLEHNLVAISYLLLSHETLYVHVNFLFQVLDDYYLAHIDSYLKCASELWILYPCNYHAL